MPYFKRAYQDQLGFIPRIRILQELAKLQFLILAKATYQQMAKRHLTKFGSCTWLNGIEWNRTYKLHGNKMNILNTRILTDTICKYVTWVKAFPVKSETRQACSLSVLLVTCLEVPAFEIRQDEINSINVEKQDLSLFGIWFYN